MPQGRHRPGYRPPRTGERRKVRQPFLIDTLGQGVRDEIQRRRNAGQSWQEISEASERFAGRRLSPKMLHRWYDVRVEQLAADAVRAKAVMEMYAGLGLKRLPAAVLNALFTEIFKVLDAKTAEERESSLGGLGLVLARLVAAQAARRRARIEERKVTLAERKFAELRKKAEKATHDAAQKLGKGGRLTLADINRIRERVFGLPPVAAPAAEA